MTACSVGESLISTATERNTAFDQAVGTFVGSARAITVPRFATLIRKP